MSAELVAAAHESSRIGRDRANSPHAWRIWLLLALGTSAVHLMTLRISPPIWQDEVEIVELGRNVFPGADRSWSTLWSPDRGPTRILNYVGPGLQELAFRLAGGSEMGPRSSALLGALVAGTCLLGWLLSRGCRPLAALICASLFLLDPLFAQSWRGARIDCWVFALIFLACWLIRRAANQTGNGSPFKLGLVAAGACLSLAGFCWASAILLVPLVFCEVVAAYRRLFTKEHIRAVVPVLSTLAGSTAVAFLLLLVPIWSSVGNSFGTSGAAVAGASGLTSVLSLGSAIARSYAWSPWVFGLGLVALFTSGNRLLLGAFIVTALGIGITTPYAHRVLYLLPYLLLGLSTILGLETEPEQKPHWRTKALRLAVCLLVAWSASLTLGARTWNALRQRHSRSPDRITELATTTIGARAAAIYSPCHEFYYAGRRLGWHQFRIFQYGGVGNEYRNSPGFLAQMQFAILRAGEPDAGLRDALERAGLVLSQTVQPGGAMPSDSSNPKGTIGFGGYLVFARAQPDTQRKGKTDGI